MILRIHSFQGNARKLLDVGRAIADQVLIFQTLIIASGLTSHNHCHTRRNCQINGTWSSNEAAGGYAERQAVTIIQGNSTRVIVSHRDAIATESAVRKGPH